MAELSGSPIAAKLTDAPRLGRASQRARSRLVIHAGKVDREYFKDLWRYRELFYVLAWRDVSVRYKQTVVGIAWAVLRPALNALVFTFVFGRLGRFPSGGVPYPVLVLTGMLPWQLFSSALSESASSLVSNSNLITKVYFPRLIVPGSAVVTSVIDFGVSLFPLAALMIAFGSIPDWRVVLLPAFLILALLTAAGFGVWFSALNVKYRDFAFVVPFFLQLGVYASPVGFTSGIVPARWKTLYALNPMVGVIDGFRWCTLRGKVVLSWPEVAISTAVAIVAAVTGFMYFRRVERGLADII